MAYNAPSWSWLSTNYPVFTYRGNVSPDAKVIDCTVEPMEANFPEGPFRSGTLIIEGAFLMEYEILGGIEIRKLYEIMIISQMNEKYVKWTDEMETEHNLYLSVDRDAHKASQHVLYLRLGSLKTHHGRLLVNSYIGLILEKATDEDFQPCFKRIGRWEHFVTKEDIMAKWTEAQRKTFRIL